MIGKGLVKGLVKGGVSYAYVCAICVPRVIASRSARRAEYYSTRMAMA